MMDSRELGNTAPPPALTEAAFDCLKAAGPWMFFLGILGFVSCGILLLGGIIIILTGDLLSSLGLNGPWMGFFYIAMSVVSFFPSRLLFLTGSKLRSLKADDSDELLEAALRNNASFWKFYGVLSIVAVSITIVALIGMCVFFAMATRGSII
jgi:hypothetical protein